MKYVPNIITSTRILASISLFFLVGKTWPFVIVALYCGLSDIADGYIARRFNVQSKGGAVLDSCADFVFFIAVVYAIFALIDLKVERYTLLVVASIIFFIRVFNFVLTRLKFKVWAGMHTVANKATGVALFLAVLIVIAVGDAPVFVTIPAAVIAMYASVEESLILLAAKTYDVNRKGLFIAEKPA